MGFPSLEEARSLVKRYNTDEFHIKHAEIVSGTMGYFAEKMELDKVELWKLVGMLHDLDFGMYPEEHCKKCVELMKAEGYDDVIIRACVSHGWGICSDVEPKSDMEKVLYAVDELTGLIGAIAIMRPSGSVMDLELKSVKKKFKQPSFAAGCSRETIKRGCDLLNWQLDYLIEETILAMRSLVDRMEI
ncbi:MAG: hydrolase [Filifactoraceae bacterium]